MKKPSLEKIIESIEIPENLDHKKALKKHLMLEAEELYSKNTAEKFGFKQLFQWGFLLTGMAVFIAFISFPWNAKPAEPDYFTFIEKAQAFAEANKSKIHYYKILTENIDTTNNISTLVNEGEIWSNEKGDEISKNKKLDDLIVNTNGDTIPTPTTINILKHDEEGNEFLYTKPLQIGTKKNENPDGTMIEEPEYLGDPQAKNAKEELEKIGSTIYCLNSQEDKNLIGVSTVSISPDGEIRFPQQNISPKTKRYQILSNLVKAFEGRLSKTDLLNILGDYKDSTLVKHQYIEENGGKYYKVSLNVKDFLWASDSPEKPDTIYSFYFDIETYALKKLEVIDQLNKTKTINFFEDKYFENLNEDDLFNTKDFILLSITSSFETKFNKNLFMDGSIDLTKGCYKNNQRLSRDENEKYFKIIDNHFGEREKKVWEQPLTDFP